METITSAHLQDQGNHTQCECGNATIHEYAWTDVSGDTQSCPLCMVEWQGDQIRALKQLVFELLSKSKAETANAINAKYAELMGCDVEDFIEDIDYSVL